MIETLPTSRVLRAFGSELAYSDALSNVHKFNSRLLRERRIRLRLPFVDSQTHIIQTPTQNHLWRQATQRLMPIRNDQVSIYARKQWCKRRPNPPSTIVQSQSSSSTLNTNEQQTDSSLTKTANTNGTIQVLLEDDPRIAVRAGDLGMSDSDIHNISTIENSAMSSGRFTGGSSDDSSQSSATPMTGLVQPQQPHWPQHNTASYNQHIHNYMVDGDDDFDDLDYDEYGGSRPSTPGGPPSPVSSSLTRSKRGGSTKRSSQTGTRKSNATGVNSNAPIHTGHRRQQYTLAELPFVCEFCSARYKTKPGLQYHLAKHKDGNSDYRPSSANVDNNGSSSPTPTNASIHMKQKYMNAPSDHHHPQPQQPPHSMYSNSSLPSGNVHLNNPSGHMPHVNAPPNMQMPSYPMNHQQPPPPPPSYGMPPSASMPLTVAALSGSAPHSNVPYFSQQQQQQQMMHQQHMMMQQQQQFQPPNKQSIPQTLITPGIQCDFCGGDEQENKVTKLPEKMITCKDCGGSAHPTCLKFTPNMVRQVKTYPWQCMECKTCTECGNSENDSELLFCDDCDRGYHMYCCSPPLSKAPDGDWRCKLCCSQFGELRS